MVRPSKPQLMTRVLDAVVNLSNSKGSSAREVLDFIQQRKTSTLKNLTLQVQRALKHAVNAGLLRHRSGRYKVLATLNPVSTPVLPVKEPANNDQKSEKGKLKSDERAPIDDTRSSRQTQKRNKVNTSRRQSGKHKDNTRRKHRRSSYVKRANGTVRDRKRRQRKRTREDEEFENQSAERYVFHDRDESPVSFNRGAKRSRVSKRELEFSDFSDGSDRESDVNRKRIFQASTSPRWLPRRKEARARSRGRSTSQARSAQRLQARPIEEVENDSRRCDESRGLTERDAEHERPRCEDVEEDRPPNDSNSGNSLENS